MANTLPARRSHLKVRISHNNQVANELKEYTLSDFERGTSQKELVVSSSEEENRFVESTVYQSPSDHQQGSNSKHVTTQGNLQNACAPRAIPVLDATLKLKLEDSKLWESFHEVGNEMIVTKPGRRMFPGLRVQIFGMDPDVSYCVSLEIRNVDEHRYKFQDGRWIVTGRGEPSISQSLFHHPNSPATGREWMKNIVSFQKVKLTNSYINTAHGKILIHSMHRYKPNIHVVRSDSLKIDPQTPGRIFNFEQTEFITVTAYQNPKVTDLKVTHNQFAKGFRKNGGKAIRKNVFPEDIQTAKRICCLQANRDFKSDPGYSINEHNFSSASPQNTTRRQSNMQLSQPRIFAPLHTASQSCRLANTCPLPAEQLMRHDSRQINVYSNPGQKNFQTNYSLANNPFSSSTRSAGFSQVTPAYAYDQKLTRSDYFHQRMTLPTKNPRIALPQGAQQHLMQQTGYNENFASRLQTMNQKYAINSWIPKKFHQQQQTEVPSNFVQPDFKKFIPGSLRGNVTNTFSEHYSSVFTGSTNEINYKPNPSHMINSASQNTMEAGVVEPSLKHFTEQYQSYHLAENNQDDFISSNFGLSE